MVTCLTSIRQRLAVTAQAPADATLAALDETLAEQAEPQTAALPEGVVAIERGVLAELQADASAGRQALKKQTDDRRDGIILDALRHGRITAAQRDQWRALLDKDEDGITALLATMAASVPVDAKAATAPEDDLSADDSNYAAIYNHTKEA